MLTCVTCLDDIADLPAPLASDEKSLLASNQNTAHLYLDVQGLWFI